MSNIGIRNLIGYTFKRDVYGLSIWTEEIVDVDYSLRLVREIPFPDGKLLSDKFEMIKARKKSGKEFGYKVEVRVKTSSGTWYNLDEIVIYEKDNKRKHS